jgi:hypothetical protein
MPAGERIADHRHRDGAGDRARRLFPCLGINHVLGHEQSADFHGVLHKRCELLSEMPLAEPFSPVLEQILKLVQRVRT